MTDGYAELTLDRQHPPAPGLLRNLRIASSSTCGIVCLLIFSWRVRSFSCWDSVWVQLPLSKSAHLISAEGRIVIWFEHSSQLKSWFRFDVDPMSIHRSGTGGDRHPWIGFYFGSNTTTLKFAHCFLMMVSAAVAALPWCPPRFGLRGFLIVTTAIAIAVSAIAAADSWPR